MIERTIEGEKFCGKMLVIVSVLRKGRMIDKSLKLCRSLCMPAKYCTSLGLLLY